MGYWNDNNGDNNDNYGGNNGCNYGGNCGKAHAPDSYTIYGGEEPPGFKWYTDEHYKNEIEPWL